MKNTLNSTIFLFLTVCLLFTGCKKETVTSSASVGDIITSGSWRLTSFTENGTEHASDFNGYVFTFGPTGSLRANRSGIIIDGTWHMNESNVNSLRISFGNNVSLKDLSKSWIVVYKSTSQFILQDDNSTHTQEVHFTKIL
ncbi:MAG: hypothetical protein JWN78_552 [Bacteroidota bacterium]|nr:hypothetical protein [Bacteroidota bacterium]